MSISCEYKLAFGPQFCISECPVNVPCGLFQYYRATKDTEIPAIDEKIIDVAVLDMNHGWPNLGHNSLVHLVQDAACDLQHVLRKAGLALRVISYDVRLSGFIPPEPGERFRIYLGTGGPANIDPYLNDGISPGSQGVIENPAWEPRAFELFESIRNDPESALLGVCHTFGTLCRWSGVAEPSLRSTEKGGKSSGILENLLTEQGINHPWFRRFSEFLPEGRRFRILDNRLFDLIPEGRLADGITPISYETLGIGGPAGKALTMLEWARDSHGVMPRIFAVNHHPEIVDRSRQLMILEEMHTSGSVTEEWYSERLEVLTNNHSDEDSEQRLTLTSDFTIVAPLRFYLLREIRRRAEALDIPVSIHEDQILNEGEL
jgi:hypothetical protein